MTGRHRRLAPVLMVFALAALLRIVLADREDLWADEIFSLAVATGHSLEHPAEAAVPALGDFVEPAGAMPAAAFGRYLEHDLPPAGMTRVVRAVLRSDTSPPLYYLVLSAWTRAAGTTDFALHALSAAFSLATLPLLWLLGLRLGGPRAATIACVLFAVAPVSLYYSVEARMYAMIWFCSTLTAWLSLRLHDRGGIVTLALWVLGTTAGFLTHYFFTFVWAACVVWLALRPGRCPRAWLAGAVAVALLAITPWYLRLPASLAQWRITGHWLDGLPAPGKLVGAPLTLGWALLSGRGVWGGAKAADALAAIVVAAAGLAWLARARRGVRENGRDLVWLWVIAACTGPVVFDLLRGTSTSLIARYALAGMPAGMLLTGLAIGALPVRTGGVALGVLIAAWAPGLRAVFGSGTRAWEPYRQVASELDAWSTPDDLVLVHSIPSGVLGIARYLHPDVPLAAWVGQLGRRRVPADIQTLLAGRRRVALVRIHDVGEPAPEETWLRAHATLLRERKRAGAAIVYFEVPTRR
ncbi:MAG TPA: glycosyltransferase family 39 protein [Gemmatimonadales bacterium]|nr:glycosyltransferase family 39 protein [Gemmatimonadales bacterium]